MKGRPLFDEIPSPQDSTLSRVQKNVLDAFARVEQDSDALGIPVLTLAASAPIPPGRAVVVFTGNAGRALALPAAAAQGSGVSSLLFVLNVSPNAVILGAPPGETVNGAASLSLGAGTMKVCASDGASRWLTT